MPSPRRFDKWDDKGGDKTLADVLRLTGADAFDAGRLAAPLLAATIGLPAELELHLATLEQRVMEVRFRSLCLRVSGLHCLHTPACFVATALRLLIGAAHPIFASEGKKGSLDDICEASKPDLCRSGDAAPAALRVCASVPSCTHGKR